MIIRQHLIAEHKLNQVDIIKEWKYFLKFKMCIIKAQKRLHFHILFLSFEVSEHILRNQNLIIGLDTFWTTFYLFGPILIYISLWIDCLFETHKFAACFPLAFVAKSLQGHWWDFFSWNSKYGPSTFLRMCSLLLKECTFVILFVSFVIRLDYEKSKESL